MDDDICKLYSEAQRIEDDEHHVERRKFVMLRKCGWDYISQTPSHWWAWQKKLADGRVVILRQSDAWDVCLRELEALARADGRHYTGDPRNEA
jgi:hypothetical protein